MMKYIGNYSNWVNPSWIKEILTLPGIGRPRDGKRPDSQEEEQEYNRARLAGYKDDVVYFWMFNEDNVTFKLPPPPFIKNNKFHWWITKMMPGNFMPMHTDPHTLYEKNSSRYWMALQDWQPGHIFMYQDQVITNYCAGDVYMYNDSTALHGAANIGHTPRLVLQISTYDE
jgi:hypothetical protein